MKKLTVLLACLLLLVTVLIPPVAAEAEPGMVLVHESIEYIDADTYYIERIYVPEISTYANTKSGTKTSQCVSGGTTIFSVSVTGHFTYDGSTATATSATGSVSTYVAGATVTSRNAYVSGASAIASASVSYGGITLSRTVRLTCSATGTLS